MSNEYVMIKGLENSFKVEGGDTAFMFNESDIKMLLEGLYALENSINLYLQLGPLAKKLKKIDIDENLLLDKHKKIIELTNQFEEMCNIK
jgi:hypothetical protein